MNIIIIEYYHAVVGRLGSILHTIIIADIIIIRTAGYYCLAIADTHTQ